MLRPASPTSRRVRTTLAGSLAALALSAAAVTPGPGALAAAPSPDDRGVAVWNHDIELGTDGAAPAYWSATPATPGTSLKVVRAVAPSPYPKYTAEKTVNHVVWVYDKTKTGGAAARGTAGNATPGRTYTVNAQVYAGSGTTARLGLEFRNAAGARVGYADQASRSPAPGVLKWVQATGVAPTGTTSVRVVIVSSYAAVGSSYWDLAYLDERLPAEPYAERLDTGAVLFVGGHRVEATTGLTRVVHPGQKYRASGDSRAATPVYDAVYGTAEGQLAHSAQLFGTVLYENGRYRMWYTAKTVDQDWSVWYAESTDGRSFPRGAQVLTGIWAGGVVRNPNTSDTARRYLMLGVKGTMPKITTVPMPPVDVTYRAYASPDGLTWTPLSSGPVLPMRDIVYVSYDAVTGRFIASSKQASGADRQSYVSTSTDFVHWTAPRQAFYADASDPAATSVYGAPVFRYGDQLLALPLMYTRGVVNGVNGPIAPQIASSTDGVHWSRPARTPLVPLSPPGAAQVDDGFILTANAPLTVGENVRLYYSGWDDGHEVANRHARIFYAEWRRDRFVSMRASAGPGTLTTKPLRPVGGNLTVNASVGTGQLRVEVLDAVTSAVVPGYGSGDSTVVTGDTLAGPVTWGGKSITDIGASRIRLRFTLTAGDLYSFRLS